MTTFPELERITFDPDVMGGKPCIRGMRIPVGTILGLIASGAEREEILRLSPIWRRKTSARRWRTRSEGNQPSATTRQIVASFESAMVSAPSGCLQSRKTHLLFGGHHELPFKSS